MRAISAFSATTADVSEMTYECYRMYSFRVNESDPCMAEIALTSNLDSIGTQMAC